MNSRKKTSACRIERIVFMYKKRKIILRYQYILKIVRVIFIYRLTEAVF